MASMVNAAFTSSSLTSALLLLNSKQSSSSLLTTPSTSISDIKPPYALSTSIVSIISKRKSSIGCFVGHSNNQNQHFIVSANANANAKDDDDDDIGNVEQVSLQRETLLYSFNPLSFMLLAAALPGAETVRSLFGPFAELVKTFNLPSWLVHWGHPGNMAVVLFAMGGYGTYLGFRIKFSDNVEEKAKAKDLHPKLLAGMFFFFALGATGGVTSLLTSDRPIFESPHAVTGIIGLALLTAQTILPTLFEGNPGLRNVHGILGSGIMTLFLVHAALGLQLGLSY